MKVYEKGETIKYTKPDGSEAEYLNGEGQRGVINSNGKLVHLNRKQYRRRNPFRATAKGYKKHTINKPKLSVILEGTNHERHLERRAARMK